LPAAIVGDLTPDDGISKEEKNRRETAAIEHMCLLLGDTAQGSMLSLSSNIDRIKAIFNTWMQNQACRTELLAMKKSELSNHSKYA
jgi:hypothetical protein